MNRIANATCARSRMDADIRLAGFLLHLPPLTLSALTRFPMRPSFGRARRCADSRDLPLFRDYRLGAISRTIPILFRRVIIALPRDSGNRTARRE